MFLYIYMVSVNFNTFNSVPVVRLNRIQPAISVKETPQPAVQKAKTVTQPSFKSDSTNNDLKVRTQLVTKDEKKKYNEILEVLDGKYKRKLEYALKSGKLLKNDSDDKSSVLDNLHKILKEERDPGLDGRTILKECLDILNNPFVITQHGEDIPNEYKMPVLGLITNMSENVEELEQVNAELDSFHTGTCPTASVEFDLATKNPAEFFRIVEGLTSPKNEATKIIDMNALNENTLDAVWLLKAFKTPHKKMDFDRAEVLLKPDKNAIIRARIQNHHRDKGERSIIDVLMQSTMMQLGSQQTYNSLTDRRAPNSWTEDTGGLIEFEKTYVESIMENKNTTSVVYQKVDENGRLVGYEKDFATIKKEIMDTLDMGHNVIIGYTWPNPDNGNRLDGHEITIVGTKEGNNGETIFICQDSDDDVDKPIEMTESYLLPKIHHAGLPEEIASRDFEYKESWKIGLDEFSQRNKKQS